MIMKLNKRKQQTSKNLDLEGISMEGFEQAIRSAV